MHVTAVSAQGQNQRLENQLKFSPLRIYDIINPGLELSYERSISERWSVEAATAYMLDLFGREQFKGYKGWRVSLSPKYFLYGSLPGRFLSPELVYYKTTFQEVTRSHDPATNQPVSDSFSVKKKMISFNVRYGKQFYFKRFMLELTAGAGIKYRDVKHVGQSIEAPLPRELNIYYSSKAERREYTLNIPVGFKIGYRF